MKRLIAVVLGATIMSGCAALAPSENVKALRLVNLTEANLVLAEAKKVKAYENVEKAERDVVDAKHAVNVAKDKFEEVYQNEQ